MGMSLAHGGHLTHGAKVNFSGKHYKIVPYGIDPETGLIDYDEMERWRSSTSPR
jgi:glycine hydroxymethyltransferase